MTVKYSCDYCDASYRSQNSARIHQKVEHEGTDGNYTTSNCDWCGSEFYHHENTVRKHCSQQCLNKKEEATQPVGNRLYGDDWEERRDAAYERDYEQCIICRESRNGSSPDLDVHHIVPSKLYDGEATQNSLRNLITVCRRCHNQLERVDNEAQVRFLREIFYEQAERRVQYLLSELNRLEDS